MVQPNSISDLHTYLGTAHQFCLLFDATSFRIYAAQFPLNYKLSYFLFGGLFVWVWPCLRKTSWTCWENNPAMMIWYHYYSRNKSGLNTTIPNCDGGFPKSTETESMGKAWQFPIVPGKKCQKLTRATSWHLPHLPFPAKERTRRLIHIIHCPEMPCSWLGEKKRICPKAWPALPGSPWKCPPQVLLFLNSHWLVPNT